jgi:hypothetical protein
VNGSFDGANEDGTVGVVIDGNRVNVPSGGGVFELGATVAVQLDSGGYPMGLLESSDAVSDLGSAVFVGGSGQALVANRELAEGLAGDLSEARTDLDAAKAELGGKLAENTAKLDELNTETLPGLTERVGSVESAAAAAQADATQAKADAVSKADAARQAAIAAAAADAKAKADQALADAKGDAKSKADAAKSAAIAAAATDAKNKADAAQAAAEGKAAVAQSAAETADRKAVAAQAAADEAQSDADALKPRASALETNLTAAQSQLTDARSDLNELNSTTLPGLQDDMRDAARLTEGTLDNARLNVGALAAQIANIIQLNVSRLVADGASINTAVINKLAVAIANVIELNADRITAGTIDTSRLDAQMVAAAIAQFLQLDVGQLTADSAEIGDVVAQKIWAGVAKFAQITTDMLVAGNATITNELLVNELVGKIITGATVNGGEIIMHGQNQSSATSYVLDNFDSYTSVPNGWVTYGNALSIDAAGRSGKCLKVTPTGTESWQAMLWPSGFFAKFPYDSTVIPFDGTTTVSIWVLSTIAQSVKFKVLMKNADGAYLSCISGVDVAAGVWTEISVTGPNGYRPKEDDPRALGDRALKLWTAVVEEAFTLAVDDLTATNVINSASSVHLYRTSGGEPTLDVVDVEGDTRIRVTALADGNASLTFFDSDGNAIVLSDQGVSSAVFREGEGESASWESIAQSVKNTGWTRVWSGGSEFIDAMVDGRTLWLDVNLTGMADGWYCPTTLPPAMWPKKAREVPAPTRDDSNNVAWAFVDAKGVMWFKVMNGTGIKGCFSLPLI